MAETGFWKMHGIGNDYIIIDNRDEKIREKDITKVAQKLCERRFSIGADGLLLVSNSAIADMKMRIFNSDGSEAEMCGNGIRCFAKFCFENNIERKTEFQIETFGGMKTIYLNFKGNSVTSVTVDMGQPLLERAKIPIRGKGKFINEDLNVNGLTFKATCLSVGNPHCVIFIDNVTIFPVSNIGPKIENHQLFPNRINVEFAQVIKRNELKVRVWERGVGETLACGTGSCATIVAGNLLGKTESVCTVHLLGGDLNIKYQDNKILMTGPAEKAFEGIVNL